MDHELLASHVDAIYGTARENFAAERDRRAKELRAAGHREEAAALKPHRKPTVPAWAVDQLARQRPAEITALIAAGEELRDAQRRATSGGGSTGLREATHRVRVLVSELGDLGREIIEASGSRPDTHLDEVEQTLFAAAVEPAHHETLRRGVFAAVLPVTGFGGLDGVTAEPAPAARRQDASDTTTGGADAAETKRREAAARQRATKRRELTQRSRELQRARDRRQRRAELAEAKVEELQARIADAGADADEQRAEVTRLDRELAAIADQLAALDD